MKRPRVVEGLKLHEHTTLVAFDPVTGECMGIVRSVGGRSFLAERFAPDGRLLPADKHGGLKLAVRSLLQREDESHPCRTTGPDTSPATSPVSPS